MNPNVIISIVSVCIAFVSVLFVILSFAKNSNKDHEKETESRIEMNVKLDKIVSDTTDIKADVKSVQKSYTDLDKRVVIVERDLKTAFNKIDEVREDNKNK